MLNYFENAIDSKKLYVKCIIFHLLANVAYKRSTILFSQKKCQDSLSRSVLLPECLFQPTQLFIMLKESLRHQFWNLQPLKPLNAFLAQKNCQTEISILCCSLDVFLCWNYWHSSVSALAPTRETISRSKRWRLHSRSQCSWRFREIDLVGCPFFRLSRMVLTL